MNASQSQVSSKELSRQLEFVKQQEQLRALGNVTGSKTLSADSMIEELLSKKETFQTNKSETPSKPEPGAGAVPPWLASPHPLYERVWVGVVGSRGYADTNRLSSLLMSSGLSTDTLGYIWSVANRTMPGELTQLEVYLALALVGLAQAGYGVNNLAAVYQLPQAPVPTLNLALLPPRTTTANIYPNPLSVTTLPEPTTFTWVPPEPVASNTADIDISYVSSGPMVSPKLLMDQSKAMLTSADTAVVSQKNIVGKKSHSKHSGNNFTFSFPSLSESPSHKPLETDSFEDEFTEFQSADFTSAASDNIKPITGGNEFSNFQTASLKSANEDLSVLVVGGKSFPTSQSLWVAENPSVPVEANKAPLSKSESNVLDLFSDNSPHLDKEQGVSKYDVFQEVEEDRFSVFHNPLADEDDTLENTTSQTVFSYSQTKPTDNSDEEFCNFQTFPLNETNQTFDKYDVFRTDSNNTKPAELVRADILTKESFPTSSFSANVDVLMSTGISKTAELDLFGNVSKEEDDDMKFGDFQESLPSGGTSNDTIPVLSMFSSLVISADHVSTDDKYGALRLLEPITDQTSSSDDFGDFLGADFPNSRPPVSKPLEQSSIQVRCMEACLNLLRAGLNTLSHISDPEVRAEVLADSRAKTYLDCLLEVHRVSERILDNMKSSDSCVTVKSELHQVWQSLAQFYTQTEHSPLTETAGVECGVCRSNTGPCPVVFGGLSFHSPCANLYLHCVDPVLPNIATVQSH